MIARPPNAAPLLSERLIWLLLAAFAGLVAWDLYLAFTSPLFYMGHDEAEHLHVVFALQRGERPYLDFIENHPVLLHALLARLLDHLHFDTTMQLYGYVKAVIAVHCVACILLFVRATRPLLQGSARQAGLMFLIGLAALGVWANANDNAVRTSNFIWQLRPDWIAYCYAMLALYLYHRTLISILSGKRTRHQLMRMVLAGVSGGVSLAILAKGVYLFIPYAVTLLAIVVTTPWTHTRQTLLAHGRRLFWPHFVFALALGLTLFASIALELRLTHVNFDSYYKANFVYNASKHVLFSSRDGNPANLIATLSGLELPGTTVLLLFVLAATLRLHAAGRLREYATLLFCANCVLFNAILPAYSNGLTWVHYFIPSLLALMTLYAYALSSAMTCAANLVETLRQRRLRANMNPALPARIATAATLVIAAIAFSQLASAAYDRYAAKRFTAELYRTATKGAVREFIPDLYLPDDLIYLTFQPNLKPVRARAWGYYFMLFADRGAHRTMRDLGLAPSLDAHWKELLKTTPPDVILATGNKDMQVHAMLTDFMLNGDIAWLWRGLASDYSCRHRLSLQILVRKDLLYRFPNPQWRDCSIDATEKNSDSY